MTRRAVLAVAALASVSSLLGGIAWACTPLPRSFMIAPDKAKAKATTKVAGQGLAPGTPLDVLWNGLEERVLGTVTVDDRGEFSLPVTVPETSPGAYAIVFMARASGGPTAVGRLPFRLTEEGAGGAGAAAGWSRPPASPTVPGSTDGGLVAGLALSGAGAVALSGGAASVVLRRRRAAAA